MSETQLSQLELQARKNKEKKVREAEERRRRNEELLAVHGKLTKKEGQS